MALTTKGTMGTQLDMTRHVHFLFIVGGALATYLAYKIVGQIWFRFTPDVSFPIAAGIGLLAGGGLAVHLWRHEKTNQLAHEAVAELSRVTWPTRQELGAATVVVMVASMIAAAILGVFDAVCGWFTDVIY